jgi:hypothetical protein
VGAAAVDGTCDRELLENQRFTFQCSGRNSYVFHIQPRTRLVVPRRSSFNWCTDTMNTRCVASSTTSATKGTQNLSNTTSTGSREDTESHRLSATLADRRKSRRKLSRTQSIIILEFPIVLPHVDQSSRASQASRHLLIQQSNIYRDMPRLSKFFSIITSLDRMTQRLMRHSRQH